MQAASRHILSWSLSPELGRVMTGRAFSIKIPRVAWLGLLSLVCVADAVVVQ